MGQVHDEDDAISIMVMVRTGSYHTISRGGGGNGKWREIFGEVSEEIMAGRKFGRLVRPSVWGRPSLCFARRLKHSLNQTQTMANDGSITISISRV